MFHQFSYVSRLSNDCAAPDIVRIVSSSRRNNASNGVTGVLYFDGKSFCHYIEGAVETIRALKQKIIVDPRHSFLRITLDRPAETRAFDGWHMGFAFHDVTAMLDAYSLLKDDVALQRGYRPSLGQMCR